MNWKQREVGGDSRVTLIRSTRRRESRVRESVDRNESGVTGSDNATAFELTPSNPD